MLGINTSKQAARLWKWVVRFGELLPPTRQWAFWNWLHSRHALLIALSGRVEDYGSRLKQGLNDETLVDARATIAADVPRTFAALDFGKRESLLLPSACNNSMHGLQERCRALERILVAIAADVPSVGYCQGLHMLVAFVLSVAEESGIRGQVAEAHTFAFVAALLEVQNIRSWLEPHLLGLRAAVNVLGMLVRERLPRLAVHLESEGAPVELLTLSWLQTLLTGLTPLTRATLCRVWECWLLDGSPKVFFRVALALLTHVERFLLDESLEQVAELLQTFPPPLDAIIDPFTLMHSAWSIKVTSSSLRRSLAAAECSIKDGRCVSVVRDTDDEARVNTQVLELENVELECIPNVIPDTLGQFGEMRWSSQRDLL